MPFGVPDTQVWLIELSCHCDAGLVIDGGTGPDLSKPWTCPKCSALVMPVSAIRWDERASRRRKEPKPGEYEATSPQCGSRDLYLGPEPAEHTCGHQPATTRTVQENADAAAE
jgi:hypothetical protein